MASSPDELAGSPERVNDTSVFSRKSEDKHKTSKAHDKSLELNDDQDMHNGEKGEGSNDPEKPRIIEVRIPQTFDRSLYETYPAQTTVANIVAKVDDFAGEEWYKIKYKDGRQEEVSKTRLLKLRNGSKALTMFNDTSSSSDDDAQGEGNSSGQASMSSALGKRRRAQTRALNMVNSRTMDLGSESDEASGSSRMKRPRTSTRLGAGSRNSARQAEAKANTMVSSESDSDDVDRTGNARSRGRGVIQPSRTRSTRSAGNTGHQKLSYDDMEVDDEGEVLKIVRDEADGDDSDGSEIIFVQKKGRGKRGKPATRGKRGRPSSRSKRLESDESDGNQAEPSRRSGRSTKAKTNMRERLEEDEMFADEVAVNKGPVVISVREVYQELPAANKFRTSHNRHCDVCDGVDKNSNKGTSPLIYCQGCTTSIHKVCLGYRSAREHIVTKVGDGDFVMQCRRCIGLARKKDETAPRLDVCQGEGCYQQGLSCAPFSTKKTPKQEEKLRTENGGVDPIADVDRSLINNAENLLFRCVECKRGFHFEHLPTDDEKEFPSVEVARKELFKDYSRDFNCEQCRSSPEKIQGLVAWRPVNISDFDPKRDDYDTYVEDYKEYLVKWDGMSYFKCTWMPGAWVWGVSAAVMRKAFAKRDEGINQKPKMTMEEAIPEEYLRMEIIFDVKYDSGRVKVRTEAVDRARIHEVEQVLVKFQGLPYSEAVWEDPPSEEDKGPNGPERWNDFKAAYNEWVAGRYFKQPPPRMKERIEDYRAQNFEKKHVLDKQPASLTGGTMKDYQLEGLNYMLYKYHQQKNCILADEMGLGKTIQVIAAIASLVKDKPKAWPFLVVVPNSTCPNWRREIKTWAPSLRVVAYYGLREAREMAMKYELYPDGATDMRAHIVVTSFDAPTDDHSRAFFKKIKWAGLFVDEGQRLKNEKNQLYTALTDLKVPFRVLLTGTPLQNNKRELFNLLHFIDSSLDAAALDEKYEELTSANLSELHDLIRPYFLRRTKAQVLKDLPPMAQVIIPVTMSRLQKELYKSILSKNPELIRSIMSKDQSKLKAGERGSLNNILMQLRKVLCHPYNYSDAVEEKHHGEDGYDKSQRGLVDASSKLQLLDILLPKLKERGHRVLIFTQFLSQLDIMEDFLLGLEIEYRRLDGQIGTIEKQKRIDEFNQPNSPISVFILSTRAGGVGINLATADTVIIMDPDFNPHQDMQALSRAHRIGQKNKVLVFQLMTKQSAEEKIVQIGRKKMALDHVLIETIDNDDENKVDVQSILTYGTQALFDEDDSQDIRYDSAAVDKLLDRSQIESTRSDADGSGDSQFSFARVWANDKNTLLDDLEDTPDLSGQTDIWEKLLEKRAEQAALEAAARHKELGRGKRNRGAVDYKSKNNAFEGDEDPSPKKHPLSKEKVGSDSSDTDFAGPAESDGEESEPGVMEMDPNELNGIVKKDASKGTRKPKVVLYRSPSKPAGKKIIQKKPIPGPKKPPKPKYDKNGIWIPSKVDIKAMTPKMPSAEELGSFPLPTRIFEKSGKTAKGAPSLAFLYAEWQMCLRRQRAISQLQLERQQKANELEDGGNLNDISPPDKSQET